MVLDPRSVEHMIQLLIQAETAAQTFYLRLMEAFAHEPKAAEVWWKMGADEAAHIRLLKPIQDSLPPERVRGRPRGSPPATPLSAGPAGGPHAPAAYCG